MSDFWKGYEPEPTKPAPVVRDELTEPLGCVVVRPLVANSTSPPAQPAPVQEPVAIVDEDGVIVVCNYKYKPGDKLYTTPPGGRQSEDRLTAAQKDIQRLRALVRAQQITIDKLEQARSAPVQEPVALPCCGYTDASAVKWNPFNGVVQCHNCGQTYTPPAGETK
jgi:hypothetical protein